MSDLTEHPMLASMGHAISHMTAEDRKLLEIDRACYGECRWYEPAGWREPDGPRPYRIPPEEWINAAHRKG
jgi:hypothetical protein